MVKHIQVTTPASVCMNEVADLENPACVTGSGVSIPIQSGVQGPNHLQALLHGSDDSPGLNRICTDFAENPVMDAIN